MKFRQVLLSAFVFVTACSSPKYVYHFDHYDYNSGKKVDAPREDLMQENPLALDEKTLVVSSTIEPLAIAEKKEAPYSSVKEVAEKFKTMSKQEKKVFRKELRRDLLNYSKKTVLKKNNAVEGVDGVEATQKFDTLVTLAIVFGGAGIVMIMLANISNAFWVAGAISLAIGAFFFVKWVANGNG